ncbi:LacI family DNA-binding transcriptional regulator [Microbacterium sp.]|uniref:LacI family DNA-binding transcriptional regulator n=1 Tax=Microbacterium sp. TaxID=51671 RepID=UPI00260F5EBB|nr:LacI family DNA-binding transcriptional regulator [Microbacterium sp.]
MNRPLRPATVIEVAQEAGVSTATAARALGNYGRVRDSTREKVLRAAEKLNYQANGLARSMITGRTKSIGVVCGDVHNPFFAGILRGITDVARTHGYSVLIANSDEDWATEVESVRTLSASAVDGLIVSPAEPKHVEHLENWSGTGKPLTLIDRSSATLQTDAVVIDGARAIQDAVTRLFELGHERVAIVGELRSAQELDHVLSLNRRGLDNLDVFTLSPSAARLVGYLRAHTYADKEIDPALVVRAGEYATAAASLATRELIGIAAAPTALVTTDNVMTLGAYRALREAGTIIPDQLSFIGFDNQDWTLLVSPDISVIDQPDYDMGRTAATMLLERIEGLNEPPRVVRAATSYLERASVAPTTKEAKRKA